MFRDVAPPGDRRLAQGEVLAIPLSQHPGFSCLLVVVVVVALMTQLFCHF